MGVRPAGEGGRQGFGRIVAGRGQGAVGEPQDHGAFHDDRQLYGQEHRCGREIQSYGHGCRGDRRRRPGARDHDGAEMAGQAGRALLRREAAPLACDGDGRPCHRHLQSDGRGWYGFYPRAFRRRQDGAPARYFEAGRCRYHHHGGVRRACQRGGGDFQGVPRVDRPPDGAQPDGAYDHRLQYVEHARCGA